MLTNIEGLTGNQYLAGSSGYEAARQQVASSTYGKQSHMNPGLIVEAHSLNDVVKTVQYAKSANLAVAIRTGGHQYFGQSSTSAGNIQLDMANAFKGATDRTVFKNADGKTFMRTSVSYSIGETNAYLHANQVFVPMGECIEVCLGGHVQTGGYGQMIRSFGLLGDHVTSLEMVDCNGKTKEVTQDSDPELFYGLLGGCPGNLGILTHFTVRTYSDTDYMRSCGLKVVYPYNPDTLQSLLEMVEKVTGNEHFPRNYDFSVRVASQNFDLHDTLKSHSAELLAKHPELATREGTPATIVAHASFVPFSQHDKVDKAWFDRINTVAEPLFSTGVQEKPMSELATWWLHSELMFKGPYCHRVYTTPSTELAAQGWSSWMVARVNEVLSSSTNDLHLYCRFDVQGGEASRLSANATNGTAFSFRDSALMAMMGIFHAGTPASQSAAESWTRTFDREAIGPSGTFAKHDRRLLMQAHGKTMNLHAQRLHFYDDEEKYQRLMKVRRDADPYGMFTPNAFCVKKAEKEITAPAVMNTGSQAVAWAREEKETVAIN